MGIVGAAAVIGVMEGLLPAGGKNRIYMRLVTGLCLLCLVVRPLSTVAEALPSFFHNAVGELTAEDEDRRAEYGAILEGEITEAVREQLRAAVERELAERFDVTRCEVGVSLCRAEGELKVERAVITLLGKDIFKDPYTIEAHFGELLGAECVVVIG